MKLRLLIPCIAAFLTIAVFSCKNNSGEEAATDQTQAGQVAAAEGTPVTAIGWDVLEGMIPATAAGLPRTNKFEDKSGLGDLGFSHSLGIYEKGDKRVELQILDAGSKKIILSTMAPWYNREVNESDMTGFEKTTTINGYPGFEKYSKGANTSEIGLVMKDRFIVMVVGKAVPIEELRKIVNGLDLKKLADL